MASVPTTVDETAGFGSIFAYGDGTTYAGSSTWTDLAGMVELEPPSETRTDIDTSHFTTTNKIRTFRAGYADPGEAAITLHFHHDLMDSLRTLRGQPKGFRITYPDGSIYGFSGYLKEIGTTVEMDGLIALPCTFKQSGDATFVEGTTES